MEIEAGRRRGLDADEARRRALAGFGGVERVREQSQEQWAFRLADDARRDVRHALRSFARSPAFTVVAVLTLALGLGANAAIFSVLDAVLRVPPPFAEPDRLAVVWETDRASGTEHEPSSVPDFLDFRARASSFSALAAFRGTEVTWRDGGGEPRRLAAVAMTPDLATVLGLQPRLGRLPRPQDGGAGAPAGGLDLGGAVGECIRRRCRRSSAVSSRSTACRTPSPACCRATPTSACARSSPAPTTGAPSPRTPRRWSRCGCRSSRIPSARRATPIRSSSSAG